MMLGEQIIIGHIKNNFTVNKWYFDETSLTYLIYLSNHIISHDILIKTNEGLIIGVNRMTFRLEAINTLMKV